MKRDNYRNRVFAAEQEVPWQKVSGQEVTQLRNRILKSAWWKKNAAPTPAGVYGTVVSFKAANGESFWCHCARHDDTGTLLYGGGSPMLRLLHALAHHMVDYTLTDDIHGPDFAKAYLTLAKRWLGQDTKDALAVAFAKHRVKTRTWSPEARAAAKHRVALKELKALREELG